MILTESELRRIVRDLLFEEVLGEPDQSKEDDRDNDDDDKDKDDEEEDDDDLLQDTKSTDEMNTVASVGLSGPMTPLGTGPDGGKGGPSAYLKGKKSKKKKKKKKA